MMKSQSRFRLWFRRSVFMLLPGAVLLLPGNILARRTLLRFAADSPQSTDAALMSVYARPIEIPTTDFNSLLAPVPGLLDRDHVRRKTLHTEGALVIVGDPDIACMPGKIKFVPGRANDEIGYIIPQSEWDEKPPGLFGSSRPVCGAINNVRPEKAPIIHRAKGELIEPHAGSSRLVEASSGVQ